MCVPNQMISIIAEMITVNEILASLLPPLISPTPLSLPTAVHVRCDLFFTFLQFHISLSSFIFLNVYISKNTTTGCSIADELFDSFENLLKVAERRGITYDRIVLENSGVAEPQNIRDQFNEAYALGHPLTRRVHLDTMITVVDSATFIKDYSSRAPIAGRPELGEGGGMRPVVDLLVEQVECADFIVLNKIDLLDEPTLDSLGAIVSSLNP